MIQHRFGDAMPRTVARAPRFLYLAACAVFVVACSPPVTEDLDGPDAALVAVHVTTTVDTTMWGALTECVDRGQPSGPAPRRGSAPEAIDKVTAFGDEPGEEVDGCGRYGVSPPVGGDWNPQVANCGFYPSPVPVPAAVTAMRRGAVWVTFRPNLSDADLETIRSATVRSGFILASPQEDLDAPLVLTAWGRQLQLDSTADQRFDDFVNTFTNNHRVPDINGPCRFGLGEPQDRYR